MTGLGHRTAETVARLFAWAGKGLGLYSAYLQLVVNSTHPSGVALAFSGCLLAGAQTFEGLALRFIDNLFDAGGPEQREEPPETRSVSRGTGGS